MSVKVEFRKDRNRFQVTYYLDGKRVRPLFLTKQEADDFARKVRLGLNPERDDSITIAEAAQKYFEQFSEKKNQKSRANDRRYLNLHFHFMTRVRGIERLGSVELEDMEALRDWLPLQTEYDDKPMRMGPSSVNRLIRVLKHFYKRHVRWKSIPENPCTYLEFLEVEENERRAMTPAEFLAARGKADGWVRTVMDFTYLTGAPPSCLVRLEWSHMDLANRQYTVRRQKGRNAKMKTTIMPMGDEVFSILVALRNATTATNPRVFVDDRGAPLRADRMSRECNRAIKAAGIPGVTLYSMRHALASDMTAANVATELVRQAMGHASIQTTQRYANKSGLKPVAGAIESVRGGSLVANNETEQRQRLAGEVV